MQRMQTAIAAGLAALLAAGCGSEKIDAPAQNSHSTAAEAAAKEASPYISAALDHSARPRADRRDDAARLPASVLTFAGVKPGMTIFEMEAGRGYYTEVFSRIVGDEGRVIMHSPEPFDAFLGDAINDRIKNGRLENVSVSKTNFDALEAADNSIDLVSWFLGPHDLYFQPRDISLGEEEKTYAEIFRILKPGGEFIVLDHAAASGAPRSTGGTTHRVDPAIIKSAAMGAGFVFIEESAVLRNPEDNYEIGIFDSAVRRKTDRFLFKFAKPTQ